MKLPAARSLLLRRLLRWSAIWAAVTLLDAALVIGCCFLYAFVIEPNRVVIERVVVERPARHGRTGTVRIAQVSDLDLTGMPGYRYRKARALVERTRADFVAFSGDLLGSDPGADQDALLEAGVEWLASLPSVHGTFIVLGEQDEPLRDRLEALLPEHVRLVEETFEIVNVNGLRVLVCGPLGHLPRIEPMDWTVGPALHLGEGVSERALLYRGEGSESWRDYEVTGRVRIHRPWSSVGIRAYASGDGLDDAGYEYGKPQGGSGFRLETVPVGLSGRRRGHTAPPSTDRWYRFRFRLETVEDGTQLRSRLWADGTPEPDEWSGDVVDRAPGRPREGTVGVVTGGWWSGREKWIDDLKVTPVGAGEGGAPLLEEGFEDRDRFERLWPGPRRDPDSYDLSVMIAHSPVVVRGVESVREPDLLLVGHTHGGQAVLPLFGPIRFGLVERLDQYSGTHRIGDMTLHINRGLGTSVLPARVNCPPEVTLIRLSAGPS